MMLTQNFDAHHGVGKEISFEKLFVPYKNN